MILISEHVNICKREVSSDRYHSLFFLSWLIELKSNSFTRRDMYSVETFGKYMQELIDSEFKNNKIVNRNEKHIYVLIIQSKEYK